MTIFFNEQRKLTEKTRNKINLTDVGVINQTNVRLNVYLL